MSEQVEAALWNALTAQGLANQPNGEVLGGEVDMHLVARAVLQALREPTDSMLDAAWRAGADPLERRHTSNIWQAMIDATLSEES